MTTEAAEAKEPKPKRNKLTMQQPVRSAMQMLDINDVCSLTRLGERTIEKMIDEGEFPKPIIVREEAKRSARRWTLKQYEVWAERRQTDAEKKIA